MKIVWDIGADARFGFYFNQVAIYAGKFSMLIYTSNNSTTMSGD